MSKDFIPLDIPGVLRLLSPSGMLARAMDGFELREGQRGMLGAVVAAYNKKTISLIEAGTGTGKSLAYILPAILWAAKTGERTLISTNTINLQEQLIHKDIPQLIKALRLDVKAVLVKGMGNYLCLHRMFEACSEVKAMPMNEGRQLRCIEEWSCSAQEGSKSELPFVPEASLWERVCVECDTCLNKKCSHYKNCFFFRAREGAQEAQIFVVNHHLLFSDLSRRWEERLSPSFSKDAESVGILPTYHRVIIDEAHHIEEIATEYFGDRASMLGMLRLLGRLAAERQGEGEPSGKIALLSQRLEKKFGTGGDEAVASIRTMLRVELPSLRHEMELWIHSAFDGLFAYMNAMGKRGDKDSEKLRLLPHHITHSLWKESLLPPVEKMVDLVSRYQQGLEGLCLSIEDLSDRRFIEETYGLRFEIRALSNRLLAIAKTLFSFVTDPYDTKVVRWIETNRRKGFSNVEAVSTELDIAHPLKEVLFGIFSTIILCSATLTTDNQFSFIRQRLGLDVVRLPDAHIGENLFASPFDYQRQALLIVPKDIPLPTRRDFFSKLIQAIWNAVCASRGNAFVLFTSYSMLHSVYEGLRGKMVEEGLVPMKQGDSNRRTLLETFKQTPRAVLFGTDSFWEGVDVVGDQLRCVILVKLPFQVPSEPIVAARMEALASLGKDPFLEFSVPHAIVKFKQGFGRLIRKQSDRGCIVCLDSRLLKRGYGRLFLNSLPPCQYEESSLEAMEERMCAFYGWQKWSVTGSNR